MLAHLPILQVVVPLLAAPTCLIFERSRAAWLLACLASFISLAISIALLQQVSDGSVIRYALGGWEAPWGIEYRIDALAAYVLLVISAIGSLVLLGARPSLNVELVPGRQTPFIVLVLLVMSGLLGIVATGDIFNVFVFLEISSLATYSMVSLGKSRGALLAAYRYLIVGTVGATFFLFGIGILYALTGTLNMLDLAERLPAVDAPWAVTSAYGFIMLGIAMKLAVFPLHGWLPEAYNRAPSIATAILAATSTKVALYLFIRMHYSVFTPELADSFMPLSQVLLVLGAAGVLVGSASAIVEHSVKRLLALSSVAQIGYMVIGVGLGSALGLQASLLHLFNHALMKAALFMAVAAVVLRVGGSKVSDFRGLGRAMPWTMAAFVIGSLSLIGVPLTVGFVSKWYLILALFDSSHWGLLVVVAIGSVLALFYIWKIIESAYFQQRDDGGVIKEAPLALLLPMWALVLANLYFGIDTAVTIEVSQTIVKSLTGGEL